MSKTIKSRPELADHLLTVADIARLDGVSEKTVRRSISAGQLGALRLGPGGRLIRITPAAHAAYRHARRG